MSPTWRRAAIAASRSTTGFSSRRWRHEVPRHPQHRRPEHVPQQAAHDAHRRRDLHRRLHPDDHVRHRHGGVELHRRTSRGDRLRGCAHGDQGPRRRSGRNGRRSAAVRSRRDEHRRRLERPDRAPGSGRRDDAGRRRDVARDRRSARRHAAGPCLGRLDRVRRQRQVPGERQHRRRRQPRRPRRRCGAGQRHRRVRSAAADELSRESRIRGCRLGSRRDGRVRPDRLPGRGARGVRHGRRRAERIAPRQRRRTQFGDGERVRDWSPAPANRTISRRRTSLRRCRSPPTRPPSRSPR